jgi:selenide,water dikinase
MTVAATAVPATAALRLTEFSQGGGCGCKIEPATLSQILSKVPKRCDNEALLVGIENSDDAAVFRLSESQALVFTNDFQSPIVDDPYQFGWIAAANALSDVYAMGGMPLLANAIVGYPSGKIDIPVVQEIMRGGVEACKAAGIPLAGGHTINNPQPLYGLAVVGTVHPNLVKTNAGARIGDVLILTKPIGIGIMATAIKTGDLSGQGYERFLKNVGAINLAGAWLGQQRAVHAMTDITGFGLAGHLLEMAKGARVAMRIDTAKVPVMDEAWGLASNGVVPSGAYRNMQSYGDQVNFGDEWDMDAQLVFTDPQTNGGLLVSVAAAQADEVIAGLRERGCQQVTVIGEVTAPRGTDAPVTFL